MPRNRPLPSGSRKKVSVICVVWSVRDILYCALVTCLVSNFFSIFSMPGTLDLLLLIFPAHEVGGIHLEGHGGDTGV